MVVYVVTDDGSLWVSGIGTDAAPRRVPVTGEWGCPRWFPDGESIVAQGGDGLAVIDIESGRTTPIPLPSEATATSCADPSPEGRRLALAVATDASEYPREIWALEVGSGQPERLGSLPAGCISNHPAWAPSGNSVVVDAVCDSQEHNGLWLFDGAGGERRLVEENAPGLEPGEGLQYWAPTWIDDDTVGFHRVRGLTTSRAQIWQVDLDGNAQPVIEADAIYPAAAP